MSKEILVCNCGSSSVKIDVFDFEDEKKNTAGASAGRVGTDETRIKIRVPGKDMEEFTPGKLDHTGAIRFIAEKFAAADVFSKEKRFAAGHRVVHGAHYISRPVPLDAENLEIIKTCSQFAPLHNPANLAGIEACRILFGTPQVGVFDTAFHADMPEKARTYALPGDLCEKYSIRRFGFHGSSHEYVARIAARQMVSEIEDLKIITLHLGNGASVCAIDRGVSIDTSMGFTPLEGLVMGTRSGDLDPALPGILAAGENLDPAALDHLLNKESGLKGICGHNDMRDILERANSGDKNCALARDVFVYRIQKYLGAYLAALSGADAIVFTGGIGENSAEIRALCLQTLEFLGIRLDSVRNKKPLEYEISQAGSKVRVFAIPTDEELMIAEKTFDLVSGA